MNEHVKDWSIELGKFAAGMVGESVINHSGVGDIKLLCKLGNRVWNKVCNNAIDHSVELSDEREKKLSTIISKITSQELPEDFEEYYQVINVAAEICLERLYIFYYEYDVKDAADLLAKEYIRKNQAVYGDKELGLLRNHLKGILQETITSIQDELHTNPEFTKKWRRYIETILKDHQYDIADLKKQNILISERIDGLDIRVEHVETDVNDIKESVQEIKNKNTKVKVRECSSDYKMNWDDVMFLEDPDSDKAVHLKDVYVLPTYQDKKKDDNSDLDKVLQGVIDAGDDFRKRMLVILGQPGSGKTTLMTYLLNECNFQKNRIVRMYCFRSFKEIDWENSEELFSQMLDSMHLQEKDLNNSVLILDGLDEVSMGNRQTDFLNDIYMKYIRTNNIKKFSLFITSRSNRIQNLKELKSRHIYINFLNEGEIEEFVNKYDEKKSNKKSYINLSENLEDVLGIPIVLYIILAKQIKIEGQTNLVEIYNMIFSVDSLYSIYSRSKYDKTHPITDVEKVEIHNFSKKVAVKMWKDNPDEATLKKESYEKIANDIVGEGKSHDLLIGQYFVEGKGGCELYFVHRSMYEYFVALSIYDSIDDMVHRGTVTEQFQELMEEDRREKTSPMSEFARMIGMYNFSVFPEIKAYLLFMLQRLEIANKGLWKELLSLFLENGFTYYVDYYKEKSLTRIRNENNRFYNLVWLTTEQIKNADRTCTYYKVSEKNEMFCYYLRQKIETKINLSGVDLSGADLSGADLSGADLSEADLSETDLNRVNLRRVNLSGADLRRADLSEADLSGADLIGADLSEADLRRADLSEVDLRGADLIGADLSGADLSEAKLIETNLSKANLSEADLRRAFLSEADLRGANLRGADLRKVYLNEVNLSGVILCGANLNRVNLRRVNLRGADLFEADLRGADLSRANLSRANLTGVILNDAIVDKEKLRKAILDKENYKKYFLEKFDLDKKELDK